VITISSLYCDACKCIHCVDICILGPKLISLDRKASILECKKALLKPNVSQFLVLSVYYFSLFFFIQFRPLYVVGLRFDSLSLNSMGPIPTPTTTRTSSPSSFSLPRAGHARRSSPTCPPTTTDTRAFSREDPREVVR